MPYWGIFRFGGSLWIFAEVTCSRIDDSMLSDLRPILHFDAIQGHISVRMRFTDHEGVGCLSLFARSRFILFDIVVIPGWGYVECLDPHVIISVRYTSGLLCIPMVLFSGHQGKSGTSDAILGLMRRSRLVEPLLAISSSLRFAAACHTGAYFPHIVSLQSGVQSRRSFTVYDIQSHHVTFFKPSPLLSFGGQSRHRFSDRRSESRSWFRRSESLSLLNFSVQSHHHCFSQLQCSEPSSLLLSVSAFRAIIGFLIDVQSCVLSFGVQSHLHLLVSAFRAITVFSVRRSEPSSVFRSTFRVASSVSAFRVVITSQFDVQSHHHHFSVTACRAIIGFQIDIQSRIIDFGVQSRYHFLSLTFRVIIIASQFDVQSHHHHFSVTACRAIIGFQIDIQSRILGFGVKVVIAFQFGVQSHHCRFSVSAFRAIIGFQIDIQSRILEPSSVFRSTFRVTSSVSAFRVVITSQFDVQSHHHHFLVSAFRAITASQFRRSEPSSVFRSTFRVAFSVSAFRVVIISQLRCSKPSSLLLSVSAFRAIIGFFIDVQSRVLSFGASRAVTVVLFRLPYRHLVYASRAIIVILFMLPEPLLSSCLGFQSRYCHLVYASRAITVILFMLPKVITIILFRLPESLLSSFYFLSSVFRCLESVLSFRVTAPSVHIHWHCASYLHGFALFLGFSSLRYPVLIAYSSRSPHRAVSFRRILVRTPG
ncbi:hypothetical protein CK203_009746 [Vitis vinifera]|uniref:Uncharacterized protein n=1 Tax=Vitis vinifera TaxID=29760 RepID=A0A438JVM6_VITVI|nr:hypothetical protein CK203_009746 [Vitis vinifera]